MQRFTFKDGEVDLPRIILGTWPFDGRDWGEPDDDEAVRTIRLALDLGIDAFDTAPVYGPEHCEIVLGQALEGRRQEAFIASKVGIRWNQVHLYQDLRYDSVKEECENSLRRLRTDWIDLLQIHWPHHETPLEEAMRALVDLREEGKIRFIGVSNFGVDLMEQARAVTELDSLQPPYHLFFRGVEAEILPYCQERDIPTLIYGPLCKGMLTGKFQDRPIPDDIRRKDPFFGDDVLPRLLEVVARLGEIAGRAGITTGQLALAYTLTRPGISAALVGARNPAQLRENAAAGDVTLAPEVISEVAECVQTAPHVV